VDNLEYQNKEKQDGCMIDSVVKILSTK